MLLWALGIQLWENSHYGGWALRAAAWKEKESDKFEHGSIKSHSLLPLPFPANWIFVTFSSVHPGIFCWSHCFLFPVVSMGAGNSVDVRYALGRTELTDYNKIIYRNTEIFSIPHEIVFFFIAPAKITQKSAASVLVHNRVTQQLRNSISSVAPRTTISVLHAIVWKVPWAVTANSWAVSLSVVPVYHTDFSIFAFLFSTKRSYYLPLILFIQKSVYLKYKDLARINL